MVIDDGSTRVALVSLDLIRLFYDAVIDIRDRIPTETSIDFATVVTTHNHEGPDLLGPWGPDRFTSGVDPGYVEFVEGQTVLSIVRAVENLRIKCHKKPLG